MIGGPAGDTGLTGRKIIVDTYGGRGAHGGGAFSGKDPSKVDRSAAYAARYIAKNLVAAGVAKECLVQIAYAIGVAEPVSVFVDTYGSSTIPGYQGQQADAYIASVIRKVFDLRPAAIIEKFGLKNQSTSHVPHTDTWDANRSSKTEYSSSDGRNLTASSCLKRVRVIIHHYGKG